MVVRQGSQPYQLGRVTTYTLQMDEDNNGIQLCTANAGEGCNSAGTVISHSLLSTTGIQKLRLRVGMTVTIAGASASYFNSDFTVTKVSGTTSFQVGDSTADVGGNGAVPTNPDDQLKSYTATDGDGNHPANGGTGVTITATYTYGSAFKLSYYGISVCVPHNIPASVFQDIVTTFIPQIATRPDMQVHTGIASQVWDFSITETHESGLLDAVSIDANGIATATLVTGAHVLAESRPASPQ